MTTQAMQEQICFDCFNRNVDKDCGVCSAHYSRGGICCFGDPDEYDEDTEDCQKCDFQDECAEAVAEAVAEAEEREIEREAIRQSYKPRPQPTIRPRERLVQIGGLRPSVSSSTRPSINPRPTPISVNSVKSTTTPATCGDEENMLSRFFKESVRGGLIGAFDMAAEFLRRHTFR